MTTEEIARAFLVPEPTVAQRIVRAKRTLSEARVPFEVPRGEDLAARLSSYGPAAGLKLVDALTSERALEGYHLLPSVRGDLLAKLGRLDEACAEFERAASLTCNARERQLLLERAAACTRSASLRSDHDDRSR